MDSKRASRTILLSFERAGRLWILQEPGGEMWNRRGQSSWWFDFSLCAGQPRGQEAATLGEERFGEKAKPKALKKAGT